DYRLASVGLCVVNTSRRGYPPEDGAHIALHEDKIQEFFFCLQELEKFSDIDLVVFVVENADETAFPSSFCDRLEIQQPQFKSHSNHCCMVQVDEEDEDGQIVPFKAQDHASDSRQRTYRLWYTIEVQASAPPPERTFEVTCAAHS
ncbi:unnamed protein product, partial [Porites evermanni]